MIDRRVGLQEVFVAAVADASRTPLGADNWSPRKSRSQMRGSSFGGMPTPVSRTRSTAALSSRVNVISTRLRRTAWYLMVLLTAILRSATAFSVKPGMLRNAYESPSSA